jgi:outer membrane protease
MRNIHPFAFFVILFILSGIAAWGEIRIFSQPYSFSLSTGPGFLFGTAYEIVYQNSKSDHYLSELQWNMKPLLYWGLDLELAPQKPMQRWGPFFGLGIKAGLPMETGDIEDRDWIPSSTRPGALTHFSSHDNHTKAAFLVNLETGLSFPLWKMLFKVYLDADYMYFKWEAQDGYTQYGPNKYEPPPPYIPWDPSFPKEPFTDMGGLGITYQQHWILISTGVGADFPFGRFTLSGTLFFSPLVFCIDIDEHHARTPPFTTTGFLYKGISLKPKLGISFLFNDHLELELFGSYLWIGETRGNVKQEEPDNTTVYENSEGARFSAFEGGISLRYRF